MSEFKEIVPEEIQKKPVSNLIIGTIPSQNELALRIVYPVILPGLEELHKHSLDWWVPFGVRRAIFDGALELSMAYRENTDVAVPDDKFQEYFARKIATPLVDYVGFYVLQYFPHSLNVYLSYVEPKYRATSASSVAFDHIEKHARSLKLPRIQAQTFLEGGVACTPDSWMMKKGFEVSATQWVKPLI